MLASLWNERISDEITILSLRRLLEEHKLATGILAVINGYIWLTVACHCNQVTIVDTTLIHAPSSTRNKDGKPVLLRCQSAHIGADDESGLVHKHGGHTIANAADGHSGRQTAAQRRERKRSVCNAENGY